MNRQSLLTLLLISAICLLVNAVASTVLWGLGGLASAVLSLIFLLNSKKVLGPEGDNAYNSCLTSVIVNGGLFLMGSTVGVVLAIFTLGIFALLTGALSFCAGIGIGIWQLLAWSKLNSTANTSAQA